MKYQFEDDRLYWELDKKFLEIEQSDDEWYNEYKRLFDHCYKLAKNNTLSYDKFREDFIKYLSKEDESNGRDSVILNAIINLENDYGLER